MNILQTIKLSTEFARIIRSWHTAEQLAAIDAENKAHPEDCASHNYCDANEAMLEAFPNVMGREHDAASQSDTDAINTAWDAAKKRGFSK